MPHEWATLYGGKMKRKSVLWEPTDLLWDGDINPEGGAVVFSRENGDFESFVNAGFFVIDETGGGSNEPWMGYVQPGFQWGRSDAAALKGSLAYYEIDSKGYAIDNAAGTNSLDGNGTQTYNYDAFSPALQLSVAEPFGGFFPYGALFAEYVNALQPDSDNEGWIVGLQVGDKKIKQFGQWQFSYLYRVIERDAFLDAFPDSDAWDGDTNVRGHEVIIQYGLAQNITFGFDYYYMTPIRGIVGIHTAGDHEHRVQADVAVKF